MTCWLNDSNRALYYSFYWNSKVSIHVTSKLQQSLLFRISVRTWWITDNIASSLNIHYTHWRLFMIKAGVLRWMKVSIGLCGWM